MIEYRWFSPLLRQLRARSGGQHRRAWMSVAMALALVVLVGAGEQGDAGTATPTSIGAPSCPAFDPDALPEVHRLPARIAAELQELASH